MKNNLKLSVLMSVYKNDNVDFFKQAMMSVIHQTLEPDEIILVIDGPVQSEMENAIKDFSKKYEKIKVFPLERNIGLGRVLRYGIEKCSYDIIARMDSDDISVEDRFEKQMELFLKDEKLSVVGAYIDEFNEDYKKPISIRSVPINEKDINKKIKARDPLNHMTVMYRKQDVLKAGSYQDFFLVEDYYLWIRMYLLKMKFLNIPEVLVHARVDENFYLRRGGKKYFESHYQLQRFMLRKKVISKRQYIFNIIIRWIVQVIVPNTIRKKIYIKFLRKSN